MKTIIAVVFALTAVAPAAFAAPYTPIGATPSRVSRGDVVFFGYAHGYGAHSTIKKEFTHEKR